MNDKNLWILTEERPKREVITKILMKFAEDEKISCSIDIIKIIPVLENNRFTFLYQITGFECNEIRNVFIKSVSGLSSFVDFLVFYQDEQPTQESIPLYAIEETKTDDKESRNTGVYQRASKFVFIERYYPKAKKIMFYNLKIKQNEDPTDTYIFGTRLLLTLGVDIWGKELDKRIFKPFASIDQIIDCKRKMRRPPKNNVPILIERKEGEITISGRLFKSNSLSHDPNIGALSLISAGIRKLGWMGRIVIVKHGLQQKHLKKKNKFIQIAHDLKLQIQDLCLPPIVKQGDYWKYEMEGEKLGTIFIHVVVENFTNGSSIFENHAGCERGYFITSEKEHIPIGKYSDRKKYKDGDRTQIIYIPDLILIDSNKNEVINIEGKKYQFRQNGIKELENFDDIEKNYIKEEYRKYKIIRTVVLYGGTEERIIETKVGFLLNKEGVLVLGTETPDLLKKAIKNLLAYWS